MTLERRLARLERVARPPVACHQCGAALSKGSGPAQVTVSWHDPGAPPPPPCAACGKTNVVWVEFDRAG